VKDRLPFRLMLATSRQRTRWPLPELVAAAVAGGVDAIQVREPHLEAAALTRLVMCLREVVGERATILINGDAGVAAALGLGLHLPERGMATASGRRVIGDGALLGRSVHSAAAATAAAGADYLLAGTLFATASKPGVAPIGLSGLREIVAASWEPVYAIGGIRAERVPEILATGAVGVAVIGAIADADDPEHAAARLRRAIDRGATEEAMEPTTSDAPADHVPIVVNGKPVEVEPDTSVTDFLADKGLQPTMVIVELNGTIIARRLYDETFFTAGDHVEMVHAVGGG